MSNKERLALADRVADRIAQNDPVIAILKAREKIEKELKKN